MDPPPGFPRNGSDNTEGYHGNGIVSSLPMQAPIVIRLDEMADWYTPADRQRRIGNRMAIAATLVAIGFVACSVHLENRTDGAGRARQMQTLLDALDAYAGSAPVVIGGDLNTHVGPGGHADASEPLFALAASRGYDWAACNLAQPTTRRAPGARARAPASSIGSARAASTVRDPAVVPALGDDASVLSDHELILLTLNRAECHEQGRKQQCNAISVHLLAATLLAALPAAARADIVLSSNDGHTVQDDQKHLVAPKDVHPDTISIIDVAHYPPTITRHGRGAGQRRRPADRGMGRQGRKLGDRHLRNQGGPAGQGRHRAGRSGQRDRPHQQAAEDHARA